MMTLIFSRQSSHERQMDGDTSMALLLRAREGDAAARDDLVQRYLPAVRRWASDRLPAGVRDLADPGDLVEDSLTEAVARFEHIEPRHHHAWHACVRLGILDRIRDLCREASDGQGAAEPGSSPLENAIGHDATQRYEAALGRLTDVDREAIVGRIEFGLGYADLAAYLSQPSEDAARIAVNRALVRLAALMA